MYGYGRVTTGNQRQDKRNAAQRGLDAIAGLLTFKNRVEGSVSYVTPNLSRLLFLWLMSVCRVSRRYSFPLRAGHKMAYLCTESTIYRYVESLDAAKKWFKANVDTILQMYGNLHQIQKEELFLGAYLLSKF